MKVDIKLKGEIEDKIFEKYKNAVEALKEVMIWYKLEFTIEENKAVE